MLKKNHFSPEQAMNLLKSAGTPCSISYVAKQLGIAWVTARALLLRLALEGKIKSQKTTTSFVFWINEKGEVSA